MPSDTVIEVVVRFAGDIVDVRYVDQLDDTIERECAFVTVTTAVVPRPRRSVPRAHFELRPLAFTIGSLIAHLGLLVVAARSVASSAPEHHVSIPSITTDSTGRRARIGTFAMSAQTVKRAAEPTPSEVPVTTDETPSPSPSVAKPRAGVQARTRGVGPPNRTEHRFDPTTNHDFDTIKTGAFATVASGRTTGEQYGVDATRTPLIVVSCDAASCIVLGGDNAAPIRKAVERHLAEITACYANESRAAGHKVEVDFGFDDRGKIGGVQVGGVGDVGTCVANIINGLDLEN